MLIAGADTCLSHISRVCTDSFVCVCFFRVSSSVVQLGTVSDVLRDGRNLNSMLSDQVTFARITYAWRLPQLDVEGVGGKEGIRCSANCELVTNALEIRQYLRIFFYAFSFRFRFVLLISLLLINMLIICSRFVRVGLLFALLCSARP